MAKETAEHHSSALEPETPVKGETRPDSKLERETSPDTELEGEIPPHTSWKVKVETKLLETRPVKRPPLREPQLGKPPRRGLLQRNPTQSLTLSPTRSRSVLKGPLPRSLLPRSILLLRGSLLRGLLPRGLNPPQPPTTTKSPSRTERGMRSV